jgi:regulatory protein
MPTITSIKPQKSKKRVNIYLDDKFGFGMDLETFLKRGLKLEQELSEEEISSIVKESEFQTTYDKILRFAAVRPRSEKEFAGWLNKYKVHESIRMELFNRLKRLGLTDDKKFSIWWIEQRMQFRPKSKRAIEEELKIKGIRKDIIDEAFSEQKVDEASAVRKLLLKKKYKWADLSGFEKRKKIYNFLLQRGFGGDVIREVLGDFNDD